MALTLETALDRAHDAMIRAGETEAARRAFFAALAAAELVVVLEAEVAPGADSLRPLTLTTEAGEIVLAFDTEARMAGFMDAGTPVATLPGRVLAQMLAPAGLGLGLNLEVAPSAILLGAEAMTWLAEIAPAETRLRNERISSMQAPDGLPAGLLDVLDARLAMLAGQGQHAYLARARFEGGETALVLGLVGTAEGARAGVTQAIAEALSLAGFADTALDVVFTDPGS